MRVERLLTLSILLMAILVNVPCVYSQSTFGAMVGLETGQVLRVDVQLTLGSVTDTVTVTGQAAIIESETATISDLRTGSQVRDLPYNFVRGDAFSGGIYKYVGLSPGAFSREGSSSNAYAGSRSGQATATFDGISLGAQHCGPHYKDAGPRGGRGPDCDARHAHRILTHPRGQSHRRMAVEYA